MPGPQGGRVFIETADAELDEAYASQHVGVQPGEYVQLSISDAGSGMNAETLLHLFEPFYTTKEPGKGTGLGLSTVYGMVKHRGGHLSVESAEGKGATFRIYFPRVQEVAASSELANPLPTEQTEPATILVVEDETSLRRLLCTSLGKRTHRVLAAKDGAEALELFHRHAGQIKLVVTDLMMPHMDGLELKQRIAAWRPDVKFLFMSGYAEQIVDLHRGSLEGCAFLEKPFLPDELANKVSSLMVSNIAA
jgi:two-component system cell cycle sensor histidine kinase/response regulator CckA